MLKSGQPVSDQWRTVNKHGARGTFHSGEIIAGRDAVETRRPRILFGGGGMQYAQVLEYDMTQSYPGSTWVHVGATNVAVTTGTIDPHSGLPVTSTPGWYCSGPSGVPTTTVDGSPAYYIPQMPLPDPGTIGSSNNYWIIFIADPQCY